MGRHLLRRDQARGRPTGDLGVYEELGGVAIRPRRSGLGGGPVGLGRPELAERGRARLAIALLPARLAEPVADADAAVAGRAVEHHVGGVDRHLLGEPPALLVLGAGLEVL